MEPSLREAHPADAWRETLAQAIDQQRRKAGERVAGQRERLHALDTRFSGLIDNVNQELAGERDEVQRTTALIQAKSAALDERQRLLDERQRQLDARQVELDKQQAELAGCNAAEAERLKDLKRRESELEADRQVLDRDAAQLKVQQESLREFESNLKLKEQTLLAREQQTKRQRQNVARQLRASKNQSAAATDQEVLARQLSELEKIRLQSQEQIELLRADYAASRDRESASLRQQIDDLHEKLSDAQATLQRATKDFEQQLVTARKSGAENPIGAKEQARLRDEIKQLEARLADAEQRAKHAGTSDDQEAGDLRRRFEMAVQDVRELKTKNVELTEEIARLQKAPAAAAPALAAGGDWESLKKQLMADLESDFNDADEVDRADKLTVQGAIKITDDVVAEKEREIEELRKLLDSQAQQVGEMAVGAAAVAQVLDTDELIRQERESLKGLQDNLRGQLRQAELDISVERAKLARERAELDEKLRSLEAEKASMSGPASAGSSDGGKKQAGRKWLTRLGLGENKES